MTPIATAKSDAVVTVTVYDWFGVYSVISFSIVITHPVVDVENFVIPIFPKSPSGADPVTREQSERKSTAVKGRHD